MHVEQAASPSIQIPLLSELLHFRQARSLQLSMQQSPPAQFSPGRNQPVALESSKQKPQLTRVRLPLDYSVSVMLATTTMMSISLIQRRFLPALELQLTQRRYTTSQVMPITTHGCGLATSKRQSAAFIVSISHPMMPATCGLAIRQRPDTQQQTQL